VGKVRSAHDQLIGARIRERRIMLGLTQRKFSDLLGVANQQIHKYERGINSISAGQLFEIASASDTPITYFFEDLGAETTEQEPRQRRLADLMCSLGKIQNGRHLEVIGLLIRVLAEPSNA
jgi:transcriptional regulator with XRE-family HTH domain